ncbi:nucleotide-binding protein [Zoogloea sp.]|uniref:nucleotide-binding protein n=1 Tax=Zoogloea sp. TaxID=49181 RepID=UPI00321FEC30
MRTCFVICAIGNPGTEVRQRADDLLELVIEPALADRGYSVVRSDKMASFSTITMDIVRLLSEAELVIADLTDLNPNVMYEVGVRHALNAPIIMMCREGATLPFDLAGYRTIMYRLHGPRDVRQTQIAVQGFVDALDHYSSPVADAISSKRFLREAGAAAVDPRSTDAILLSMNERIGGLEAKLNAAFSAKESPRTAKYTRDVFIVHGHDSELKTELARFLERLEFNPIILHEQPERGQTIIQKLDFESSKVGFAFVLHTPDDQGCKKGTSETLVDRSRQNVVFEHGLFVGRYGSCRVCAIVRAGVELPSDLSGVVYKYIPAGGNIQSIALDIVRELRAADYDVDANKIM